MSASNLPIRALGGALASVPDGRADGDLLDQVRGVEVQPCEFGGPHGCTHPGDVELYVPSLNLHRIVCRDHAHTVLLLAGCDVHAGGHGVVVEQVFRPLERAA